MPLTIAPLYARAVDVAEWQAEVNEAHRAVGRYVVEFSLLVSRMRTLAGERLRGGEDCDELAPPLAELMLGEMSAGLVANGFFGMCHYVGDFEKPEKDVAIALHKAVGTTTRKRNDVAHGDWFIGSTIGGEGVQPPFLLRIRPELGTGAESFKEYKASDLDERSDRIIDLTRDVHDFGCLALGLPVLDLAKPQGEQVCRGRFRVRDVFETAGSKVVRTGPIAARLGRVRYRPDGAE